MILIWVTLSGIVSFILGKIYAESEKILAQKRKLYEEFLRNCPVPNETYLTTSSEASPFELVEFQRNYGALLFYASPAVTLAINQYMMIFRRAAIELSENSPPLSPLFKEVAKSHNDLILEMRRDGFSWSVFAYRGESRLPKDALEKAKLNTLD